MERSQASTSQGESIRCEELKIVLVDDEPSFRINLADSLRDDGHPVLEFAGSDELPLEDGRLSRAGVLITDYSLPGRLNGLELVDRFHEAYPHAPAILVTAYLTQRVEEEAKTRSFLRVCSKPVDYQRLHDLVHEIAELVRKE